MKSLSTCSVVPVFTLTPPDNIPDWIVGAPARHLQQMIQFACVNAAVTGNARLRFLCEADVLKKKNLPASSIVLQNSSRYHGIDTLTLIATGQNPRNHKVRCTLTMESSQCERLATFITDQSKSTFLLDSFRNPVLPPGARHSDAAPEGNTDTLVLRPGSLTKVVPANSTPSATTFDDDTLALFLDAVRDAGRTITKATAETLARKLTNDTHLVTVALQAELIAPMSLATPDLYSITIAGDTLLRQKIDSPASNGGVPFGAAQPAPSDTPSELDRLKAAVRAARTHHSTIEAEHVRHSAARAVLEQDLTKARTALKDSETALQHLQDRITKLQADARNERAHVLRLEAQHRALPDEQSLHAAQRTLEAAERAYNDLIKL